MRKKSILMVCISALIALTMFVGCDNAPVLPSFVVGGNVVQTGDFLEGQVFDPSKFSVTVTYDNGRIVAADETVKITLAYPDGIVNLGDEAEVNYGISYEGDPVTETFGIDVDYLTSITVEGPATVTYGSMLTNSDFTVTANYGDGQTMVLDSTEFEISSIEYANNVKPTAANPTVKASVVVTPTVGNKYEYGTWYIKAEHEFDCTYEATAELPGPVEEIQITKAGESAINIPAMTDVYPSFDDYKIEVKIAGYTENSGWYELEEDPGVVLTYVDEYGDDLEGNLAGLDNTAEIAVKAEYEGYVAYLEKTNNLTIVTPTLTVTASDDFEVADVVAGATLPTLTSDGLSAVLDVNGEKSRVSADDLTVAFYNGSGEVITTAPAASSEVYVRVSYRGVLSASIKNVTVEDAPAIKEIKSIELVDGFTLVKQIYEELPEALSAVESITVVMDDDSETVISSDALEENATVTFTSDTAGNTPLTTNLTSATSAYAKVIVGSVAKVVPVTLVDAVVDELVVTLAYSDEDMTAPLLEATMTITPELTTTTGGTLSTTGVMYIDTETGHYSTLSSPVTLDANEHTYKAAIWVGDELVESEEFTIPAGIGYVNVEEANISTSITVAKAGTYLALIDDPISDDPDDYVVTVENAATVVKGDAKVTITSIEFPADQKVQDSGNKVWANISYVGPTGETITGRVEVSPFAGTAYVEVLSSGLRVMYEDPETGEKTEITQFNRAETYVVENLSVEGFINHEATAPTVAITNEWNGDAASGTNLELQGSSMKFTITFTGFNAEENKVESGMTASVTIPVVG